MEKVIIKVDFDLVLNTASKIKDEFNKDEKEWLIEILKEEI
jgi:hypothetical protein